MRNYNKISVLDNIYLEIFFKNEIEPILYQTSINEIAFLNNILTINNINISTPNLSNSILTIIIANNQDASIYVNKTPIYNGFLYWEFHDPIESLNVTSEVTYLKLLDEINEPNQLSLTKRTEQNINSLYFHYLEAKTLSIVNNTSEIIPINFFSSNNSFIVEYIPETIAPKTTIQLIIKNVSPSNSYLIINNSLIYCYSIEDNNYFKDNYFINKRTISDIPFDNTEGFYKNYDPIFSYIDGIFTIIYSNFKKIDIEGSSFDTGLPNLDILGITGVGFSINKKQRVIP